MLEFLSEYWRPLAVVGAFIGFCVFAAWADHESELALPKTDKGLAIQSAELDGGVTCYVVRASDGVAISCLRRPQ